MMDWSGINITDGTAQDERGSPALKKDYFNVDEQTFETLLAMGHEFASVIKYHNLKNQPDGNWDYLFSADEAVILSMIISADLKCLERDFLKVSYQNSPEALANFTLGLVKKINFWYVKLKRSQHQSGEVIAQKLGAIISEKLAVELDKLFELAAHAQISVDKLDSVDLASFDQIWFIKGRGQYKQPVESNQNSTIDTARLQQKLAAFFYIFLNAISYLKTITPIFLQESLNSQKHDPAIGLFMVFLKHTNK